ncbi:hypothetical protein [Citrobacter phage Tr1]|nr:hypothetical protein [Citrobacter phage Tr1]
MTGCSSSTSPSQPILIEQCKAVASENVQGVDKADLEKPSTPILYTEEQLAKGVSRSEVVSNQTANNALWDKDRQKLLSLQEYVRTLQDSGIISK